VAIGAEEHHRLRALLDQIYGDQNFTADIVWQGRRNDARFVSTGADYMLVNAKDQKLLTVSRRQRRSPNNAHGRAQPGFGAPLLAKTRLSPWSRPRPPHPPGGRRHCGLEESCRRYLER
jgi:hypothetical protein